MKEQTKVKIIGLKINKQLGILHACQLTFGEDNKLIIIKGGVGDGKTTLHRGLQLGTLGSKTLKDNKLYGDNIDLETQLLDGDMPIFVGCKSDKDSLTYTLYSRDREGKIIKEPVIDGVKATPAKYLETLQTELTWRMNDLTSENPTTHKNILLKLYQFALTKIGVVFDKTLPGYKDTILHQIDEAESVRDEKDMTRKQYGGIAEDLKAQGYDPDRPDTIPDEVDISQIDLKIKEQERLKTVEETKCESGKAGKLQELKLEVSELTNKCMSYNNKIELEYDKKKAAFIQTEKINNEIKEIKSNFLNYMDRLNNMEALSHEGRRMLAEMIEDNVKFKDKAEKPIESLFIRINDDGKVDLKNIDQYPEEAVELLNQILSIKEKYYEALNSESVTPDVAGFNTEIQRLKEQKNNANGTNLIVKAVDSFHKWRDSHAKVLEKKREYQKMLDGIDTGVPGLRIIAQEKKEGFDLFLMYDGRDDPEYFSNFHSEYRKLSSYSGTQKVMICLLMQNYLLNRKPKALRYMYIDNTPIDNKTRVLLENMCEKLNLRIFLNLTGDFDKNAINDGEILIEGGEVFFN